MIVFNDDLNLTEIKCIEDYLLYDKYISTPLQQEGSVTNFSIHIVDDPLAASNNTVALTLWWDNIIYQCLIHPYMFNTRYTCSSSNWNIISNATNNCDEYKIMIDNNGNNNGNDSIIIDEIIVNTISGDYYGINGWCVDTEYYIYAESNDNLTLCGDSSITKHTKGIRIDNAIPRQMIYFYENKQYINQY